MTRLDKIKRSLFSASDLSDALAKLDAQRISYRECAVCENTYHLIEEDVTFWVPRRGHPLTLHICIGDVIATAEYREAFFAQQQPELSKSVPAHDSPVAVEHLHPAPVWKNVIVNSFLSTRDELMKDAFTEGQSIPDFHLQSFMLGVSSMCGDGLINLAKAVNND